MFCHSFMKKMCRIPCVLVFVLFVINTSGMKGGCPYQWRSFQNRCYRGFHIKVNWMTAQLTCGTHGADLAQVNNAAANKWLSNNYGSASNWIGGTDLGEEGQWRWISSGQGFHYSNWDRKEPNNARRNEHCLQLYAKGTRKAYRWNDYYCDKKLSFICEKRRP